MTARRKTFQKNETVRASQRARADIASGSVEMAPAAPCLARGKGKARPPFIKREDRRARSNTTVLKWRHTPNQRRRRKLSVADDVRSRRVVCSFSAPHAATHTSVAASKPWPPRSAPSARADRRGHAQTQTRARWPALRSSTMAENLRQPFLSLDFSAIVRPSSAHGAKEPA